jgi:signal transduction histidine kinase
MGAGATEMPASPVTATTASWGQALGRPSSQPITATSQWASASVQPTMAPATTGRAGLVRRWFKSLGALGMSFVVSIVVFTIAIAFFFTSIGTVVIWIGLPMLVATMWFSRSYSMMKKRLALWQGAADWPETPIARRGGAFGWIWSNLRSGRRWRELTFAAFGSLADWLLALLPITVLLAGLTELLSPFTRIGSGVTCINGPCVQVEGLTGIWESLAFSGHMPRAWLGGFAHVLDFATGIGAIALALVLVPLAAWAQIGLTRLFLAPSRATIDAALHQSESAKLAGQQAEAANLGRIERDLHDGPQQRLLRNSMDLAALQRRLDAGDIAGAQVLLQETRQRNDETIAEIRNLSRGFAPPVLTDLGLVAAIDSLAGVSPIPVSVNAAMLDQRPPQAVERAFYFAISESLANAAKHSGAQSINIDIHQTSSRLTASISDNGRGGASILPGHGLAGLATRLEAVGGQLEIDSSAATGTTIRLTAPNMA